MAKTALRPALLDVGHSTEGPLEPRTAKRLPLRANFAWTLAGNVTSAACAWLTVVAIVKLGSMEMAGQYALSQAIVVPILGFSMLQLRAVLATDAGHEFRFGHYLAIRAITTALAFLAIAAAGYSTTYSSGIQQLTLAVGFGAAIESLADILYGGIQQRERMNWIAISMICRSVSALAATVGVLWMTSSIASSIWTGAAAKAIVLAVVDIPLAVALLGDSRSWGAARDWIETLINEARNTRSLIRLAWYAFPLGIVMLLLTLQTSLPRYFIEHWLGSAHLGVFSALSYAAISGTIIVSALAQAAAPRMAQHYVRSDAGSYYALLGKLAALGGTLGLCGIVVSISFGRYLLALIYSPQYAEHNTTFVWLMTASAVSYVSTFFGWGMTAARQVRVQLPLFASVVLAMAAAGYLLVPQWGLTGAAWSVLLGALVQLLGTLILVLRAVPRCGASVCCVLACQSETQS